MKRYRVTFTIDLEADDSVDAVELAADRIANSTVDCRVLPPVERVALAGELRALRERTGKNQAQVAAEMEWSDSKMSRIEAAQTGVIPRDVRDLLAFYGVDGPERDRLIQVARDLRSAR